MINFSLFFKNFPQRWYHFLSIFQKNSLIEFCFYIEQFLKAGWSLIDSLRELMVLLPALEKPLKQSILLIEKGVIFSVVLEDFPFLFNHFFRSCIATYEKIGNLAEGFKEVGSYLKWKKDFNHQLFQALLYPCLSLGLLMISGIVLYTFFVPELIVFLNHMDQEIPFLTQIVLKVLEYLGEGIKIGVFIVMIGGIAIKTIIHLSTHCRLIWDKMIYKIPYIGKIKKKQHLIHFLKIIEVFHRQGGDIVTAVKTAVISIHNTYFRSIGNKTIDHLLIGKTFSQALEIDRFIPSLIIKILKTGEKTNNFPASFQMIFYLYEQALNKEKFMLLSFIQPCLLLISGVLLGSLFYAIFSPLYNIMGGMV